MDKKRLSTEEIEKMNKVDKIELIINDLETAMECLEAAKKKSLRMNLVNNINLIESVAHLKGEIYNWKQIKDVVGGE